LSVYVNVFHRDLHSFPTRRSSDLGRAKEGVDLGVESRGVEYSTVVDQGVEAEVDGVVDRRLLHVAEHQRLGAPTVPVGAAQRVVDRKSTRLNSSHLVISYAVFCLK